MTNVAPTDNDVLFGRGSVIAAHPGNQRLRSLVRQRKPQFIATKRQLKREIAYNIVDEILASGGRFVAEDTTAANNKSGSAVTSHDGIIGLYGRIWITVDREKARGKVMHQLREKDVPSNSFDEQVVLSQQTRSQDGIIKVQASSAGSSMTAGVDTQKRSSKSSDNSIGIVQQQEQPYGTTPGTTLGMSQTLLDTDMMIPIQNNSLKWGGVQASLSSNVSAKTEVMQEMEQQLHQLQQVQQPSYSVDEYTNNVSAKAEVPSLAVQLSNKNGLLESVGGNGNIMNQLMQQVQREVDESTNNILESSRIRNDSSVPYNHTDWDVGKPQEQTFHAPMTANRQPNPGDFYSSDLSQQQQQQVQSSGGVPYQAMSYDQQSEVTVQAQNQAYSVPQEQTFGLPSDLYAIGELLNCEIDREDPSPLPCISPSLLNQGHTNNFKSEGPSLNSQLSISSSPSLYSHHTPSPSTALDGNGIPYHSTIIKNSYDGSLGNGEKSLNSQLSISSSPSLHSLQTPSPTLDGNGIPYHSTIIKSLYDGSLGNGEKPSHDVTGNRFFYFPSRKHNSPTESFPMSVMQYLESGYLLNRIALSGEGSATARDDIGHDDKSHEMQLVQNENSVCLAILITHLFVTNLPSLDLGSIQLNDFMISLEEQDLAPSMCNTHQAPNENMVLTLRMDVNSSQRKANLLNHSKESAMQVLGQLLYSTFSQGESLPPELMDLLAKSLCPEGEEDNDDFDDRLLFQRLRVTENTVFSKLSQGKRIFSLPICRFLSDMMDIGPKGNADLPFESFVQILRDLEKMVSHPKTFLHDSSAFPLSEPQSPFFGQRFHERKEIHALRQAVFQIEANLRPPSVGVEALFVSGVAGSGKSHLVRAVREQLSSRWIVIQGKLERGKEHTSRMLISSMFDQLISNLVKTKTSQNYADVAYCRRVSDAILKNVGIETLSWLRHFLPSLPLLFPNISSDVKMVTQTDDSWQLIYSLSKVIEALLDNDKFIMICLDDLQWGDKSSLSLISEVIVNIGNAKHIRSRCIFVGLFRDNEVDENHPFTVQFSYLQMMTSSVNTTSIKLSRLSKKNVSAMLMAEFHLPERYVVELAAIVHKKSSGHAFFLCEMLNSLLRSNTIAYSTQSKRYEWDDDTVGFVPTGDGVAGFIASNIKALPLPNQEILQIISCFGMQSDLSILMILERELELDIVSPIEEFIDLGIVDRAGSIVMFNHDILAESCYNSIGLSERQALHLKIGKCLGLASINGNAADGDQTPTRCDSLLFVGSNFTSSLMAIACDQIDNVGVDGIQDFGERQTFASWNLSAGCAASSESNAAAAFHYYSKGIVLFLSLGQDCWLNELPLGLSLHEGAVMASSAIGEPDDVIKYADEVIKFASFDDCLDIQPYVLRSLSQKGKHEAAIQRGIECLRQLDFDLPTAPTIECIMESISSTSQMAAQYTIDQMVDMCEALVEDSVHQVVKIMNAFYISCYASSSPYLPIISGEIIQYSLKHGIHSESILAFSTFGMLKIFNEGDYKGGQRWADIVNETMKKHRSINQSKRIKCFEIRPLLLVYLTIDIWHTSPRKLSQTLLDYHKSAMQMGHVDVAMISLQTCWRFRLLGGEKLSLIAKQSKNRLRLLSKHSEYAAKCALLDNMLLTELTGQTDDFFTLFKGPINSMNDLQDLAKATKDLHLLQSSHVFNVLIEYWKGNYTAAENSSNIASMMLPAAKMPTIYLIYHTFFRGLLLFRLYRMYGDNQRLDNQRLEDGKNMLDLMQKWANYTRDVFENKLLLLKAEYYACRLSKLETLQLYEGSIKSAKDHGNLHEAGLSYKLLGDYYASNGNETEAIQSWKKSYLYLKTWGATAVAESLSKDHNLEGKASSIVGCKQDYSKRRRDAD